MVDFETVTPDLWMANEEAWKEKLLKLPNLFQVKNIIIAGYICNKTVMFLFFI